MKNLLQVAKNKYFLVAAFFLIWIGFFDQNDWLSRRSIDKEIDKLEEDKAFFSAEVERLKKEEKTLRESDAELEKYAREQFYMKKEGEDLFVIVEE
ncbi:septum formation initiator family protein [bacterium]|nr:septum formation initiator family protein [bacterium]